MDDPSYNAGRAVGRLVAAVIWGGLWFAAAVMVVSIWDRSDIPVQAISGTTVAVAVAAAIAAGAGLVYLAITKDRDVLLLAAAATALSVLTLVGMFSIGILVLPFAVGSIVLLVRRSSGRTGLTREFVAGPAIALGLSLLFIVWVQPPLVECRENGAATSSKPWWNSGSSSGQSTAAQSNEKVTSGTIGTPDGQYVFRCTDGELTQFRRIGTG